MSHSTRTIADLTTDADEFDRLVSDLDSEEWTRETPAPGWTVAHQVGHLAFIFTIAGMAAGDPARFTAMTAKIGNGFDGAVNAALAGYLPLQRSELLARWRAERDAGIAALAAVPPDQMVPWLVNPLPPTVLAQAGMMELFAHGQDVADALGVTRTATDRIERVVDFAVRTRDFGYLARGIPPATEPFLFELTAPSGEMWRYGPSDATQRVSGPALDFCLLVTRRRHRTDLALVAEGADADRWMDIAQAYRGPAGAGRRPGQFAPVR